ncbi:restriction endonuclease subunit S [Pseudomonas veronii]
MKQGWPTEPLMSLCELFADGDWIESKDQSSEGIRLIQTGNVGEGVFKDRGEKARYISAATFERLRCREIFEGDCLVSRLPEPAGRSCMLPDTGERMITAVDCTIVRFSAQKIIPEFFNFYSQSREYLKEIDGETTGTTRKRISRSKLGEVLVPVPPLSEQQRIVSILDEAFEGISKARSNAEKNLLNARELFDSTLNAVTGERAFLGDYVTIKTGKLDANAATEDGVYPFFTCAKEVYSIDKFAFDCEAILLAGNNAVGDFNVKHYRGKFNAYQRTYVITLNDESSLLYRFLYYQMLKSLKRFKEQSVGSGTKFLKIGMIKELEISLPSIPEQSLIIGMLDAVLQESLRLETLYQKKLAALDDLKKSLLHQAFTGNL